MHSSYNILHRPLIDRIPKCLRGGLPSTHHQPPPHPRCRPPLPLPHCRWLCGCFYIPATCECKMFKQILLHKVGFECAKRNH